MIYGCYLIFDLKFAHHSYSAEVNGARGEKCDVSIRNAGKSQLDADIVVSLATIKMY